MKNLSQILFDLFIEEKQSVSKAANDFEINQQTLRNWLKANDDKQDPEKNRIAELEAKHKEEMRKNADLQPTIDMLKKATAIFVQDNRT